MLKNPSEQLVLLTLDELAEAARNIGHEDADMYIELARQASLNQGKFPIASFVPSVLGGKASDLITKALTKSLKDKSRNKKEETTTKQPDAPKQSVPFMPPGQGYMYPPWMYQMGYIHQPSYNSSFQGRYGSFRGGSSRPTYRQRDACHFCDSTSHLIRDCEKMKMAKNK